MLPLPIAPRPFSQPALLQPSCPTGYAQFTHITFHFYLPPKMVITSVKVLPFNHADNAGLKKVDNTDSKFASWFPYAPDPDPELFGIHFVDEKKVVGWCWVLVPGEYLMEGANTSIQLGDGEVSIKFWKVQNPSGKETVLWYNSPTKPPSNGQKP